MEYNEWHADITILSNWSFRDFKRDAPTGILEKKQILELYGQIVPEAQGNTKFFAEQIFRLFDMDRNGVIDFKVSF